MRGVVITARGERLNMEELALKAKRPLTSNVDMKDKVVVKSPPARQLNVRGFVPSAQGVPQSVTISEPLAEEHASMADFTGVRINKSSRITEPPADASAAANAALQEIFNDLEQYKDRPAESPRRKKS